MQEATPRSALKLGLVMALANPKVLLLAVAGGLGIGEEDYTVAENAAAVVGFSVVASLTVAAPLVMTLVTGSRAEPLLQRAREWLDAHNQAVVAVVLVLLGALVLVAGWQAVPGG
jgi:threonine/homoserine/homoserine lactone efflux protein